MAMVFLYAGLGAMIKSRDWLFLLSLIWILLMRKACMPFDKKMRHILAVLRAA